ncbi:hemerythrin domain-containing protein [Pontibacter vulgaris]|uniref:hemerythrin domain-containing protein n=1 Tax=Pontibacter vulgaris TaxID=2905679 RepID=UPI001FA7920C|nr:hemerythrin domain-containing protein [Pontibacter vulgaris]
MKYPVLVMTIVLTASLSLQAQNHKDSTHLKQPKEKKTATAMKFQIPKSLKAEHEELHQNLEKFTRLPGKTGVAAKSVAKMLHPHFVKEEEYALPPLGLLPALAKGQAPADAKAAIAMSEKLKQEFQQMLKEHQQIVTTLEALNKAATDEKHSEVVRFTEALKLHAQTEEEVLYPTAILIGEYLKLKQ